MQKYLLYYFLVFTVVTGFYFFYGYAQLSGSGYVFPIDDAYIHLALSRNFADFGIWSVHKNTFDSASSSILYTLLLSFFIKIFGSSVYISVFLNVVSGYFATYWLYRFFKDFYAEKELLLGLFFLLPVSSLYAMVIIGMEQTLHIFLTVVAIYYLRKNILQNFEGRDFVKLLIVVFFVGTVRFESMFFTVALSFLLILNGFFKKSFFVLVAGFVPILIFGSISLKYGGYFFPNSVLVKGSYPEGNVLEALFQIFIKKVILNATFYKLFLFPFAIIFVYLFSKYRKVGFQQMLKNEGIIIVVVITAMLQSVFAEIKYRYENYVMVALLMVLVPVIAEVWSKIKLKNRKSFLNVVFAFSVLGFVLMSLYRFAGNHFPLKYASKNVQEQQVEMARFLSTFYSGEKVVVNDIGAVSFYGNVNFLDVAGLGSTDVAKFIVQNKKLPEKEFDSKFHKFLDNYINKNNYKIAIIYPGWFPDGVPKTWAPVASWTILHKYGVAREKVVVYAISANEIPKLQKSLERFNLNKNVKQEFYAR